MASEVVSPGIQTYNSSQRVLKTVTFGPATVSGTSTATGATTLTDSGAGWTIDAFIGLTIYSNGSSAVITTNSATVITVAAWTGGTPTAVKGYMVAAASVNGPIGTIPLFTVSGIVVVRMFMMVVTTSLTDVAANSAVLAAGITDQTSLFHSSGSLSAQALINKFANLSGFALGGVAISTASSSTMPDTVIGENIVETISSGTITAGTIDHYVYWDPFTAGATIT